MNNTKNRSYFTNKLPILLAIISSILLFLGLYFKLSEFKNENETKQNIYNAQIAEEKSKSDFKQEENLDLSRRLQKCEQTEDLFSESIGNEADQLNRLNETIEKQIPQEYVSKIKKNLPITSATDVIVSAEKLGNGKKHKYRMDIHLDVADGRASEIDNVDYLFHQQQDALPNKASKDPNSNFSASIYVDGCISNLPIRITTDSGEQRFLQANLCKKLGWDGEKDGLSTKEMAIYYVSASDIKIIRAIFSRLKPYRSDGYYVSTHPLVKHNYDAEVRYFSDDDESMAETIRRIVEEALSSNEIKTEVKKSNIHKYFKHQPSGRFEIWLPELHRNAE